MGAEGFSKRKGRLKLRGDDDWAVNALGDHESLHPSSTECLRNRNAVVLFPCQLLKRLLILRAQLMAVPHHRVTPPVVQLVQHPREAAALLVGLGKHLQLLTAVLDVGEAHTHQA